jgi:hypothetical protein
LLISGKILTTPALEEALSNQLSAFSENKAISRQLSGASNQLSAVSYQQK